jgi:hydroxymethylbilane synthase
LTAPKRLVIASRESRLAMWQAEHIRTALQRLYPQCEVTILGMTTRGDQILDRALSAVGGKGLFIKELEVALLEGRADLAVHSLKDVPMDVADEFALAAVLAREDPRDAFVSQRYGALGDLPAGAVVGTSSLRRETQILARFPQLTVSPLRGNLDTRLSKLDRGDYAAIVLAAAGLKRLGLAERIRGLLAPDESLPAAGQGALAIETRSDRPELAEWLAPLHDARTAAEVEAERAVSRALGGSCQVPLAAYATTEPEGGLRLRALVGDRGGNVLRAERSGREAPRDLGRAVADDLLGLGAGARIPQS